MIIHNQEAINRLCNADMAIYDLETRGNRRLTIIEADLLINPIKYYLNYI